MGVVEFFGDRLRGFRQGFTQGVREQEENIEAQKQNNQQSKTDAILRGHTAAMQIASQYGLPGNQEWIDAYSTIAAQSGVPQPYIDQVRKLTVNPEYAKIAKARENTTHRGGWNYVPPETLDTSPAPTPKQTVPSSSSTAGKSLLDSVKQTLAQMKAGANPQTMAGAMAQNPSIQTAGSPVTNMVAGPTATASAIPRYVDSPRGGPAAGTPTATPVSQPSAQPTPAAQPSAATPTPAAQPSAAKKSSWRDLISGIGKAFVTANGMSGASGMAGSPAAVASMANPNLDVVTGKDIPEDAVRADQTPTTMKDIGIESVDDAEQFQALEAMVGKSLPEGFDLRVDYGRDPEFYATLFKAIRDGVKDERNPGKRRKLSMQEIIAMIMGE